MTERQAAVEVIKELQATVAKIDDQIETTKRAQRRASDANARHGRECTALGVAQGERDRLAAAADLLAPDWRTWPWVQEAGFSAKVPAVQPRDDRVTDAARIAV